MERTKALLVYFIKNSPRILGRTELMKYLYTFEYYYYQMRKERFTEIEFTRYHYGPNDQSVVDATIQLDVEGLISIRAFDNYYGGTTYNHIFIDKPDEPRYDLPKDAELVACFIVDRFSEESHKSVIDYSYDTPPMRVILQNEKIIGTQLLGRVINMDEREPIFKSTAQQKEEARRRLKERRDLNAVTDEEYYAHVAEQYGLFQDLKRRVEIVESEICR